MILGAYFFEYLSCYNKKFPYYFFIIVFLRCFEQNLEKILMINYALCTKTLIENVLIYHLIYQFKMTI